MSETILFLYGTDPETGNAVELEGTLADALEAAALHGCELTGWLSDDPETQDAQGPKLKVSAAGNYRWL